MATLPLIHWAWGGDTARLDRLEPDLPTVRAIVPNDQQCGLYPKSPIEIETYPGGATQFFLDHRKSISVEIDVLISQRYPDTSPRLYTGAIITDFETWFPWWSDHYAQAANDEWRTYTETGRNHRLRLEHLAAAEREDYYRLAYFDISRTYWITTHRELKRLYPNATIGAYLWLGGYGDLVGEGGRAQVEWALDRMRLVNDQWLPLLDDDSIDMVFSEVYVLLETAAVHDPANGKQSAAARDMLIKGRLDETARVVSRLRKPKPVSCFIHPRPGLPKRFPMDRRRAFVTAEDDRALLGAIAERGYGITAWNFIPPVWQEEDFPQYLATDAELTAYTDRLSRLVREVWDLPAITAAEVS